MSPIRCLVFLVMSLAGFAAAAESLPPGKGSFVYSQAGKQVHVWYFLPAEAQPDTPVVIVMHGVGRNGEDYLNDWLPHAQKAKFLLVVPEFSKREFPGVEGYNCGNTVNTAGRALPREQWSFNMIEPIFDVVRARTGNRSERYRLFGHSAGSQFVQRFVYFVPTARLEAVVCANAGWYMLPDLSVSFPYGLKNTPVTEADLRHALSLPLTVLLGTSDVDPEAQSLRHTPEADAQGLYRFARGKFFVRHAEEVARKYQMPLVWRQAVAPDVAHSDKDIAPFAMLQLFPIKNSTNNPNHHAQP